MPRSKNYAGPQPQIDHNKPVDKVGITAEEFKNPYRWKNLRSGVNKDWLDNIETTPITKEKLMESRCKKRTCRKKYTPKVKGQFLCDDHWDFDRT